MKGLLSTRRSLQATLLALLAMVLIASPAAADKPGVQSFTVEDWKWTVSGGTGTITAVNVNWDGYPKATVLYLIVRKEGRQFMDESYYIVEGPVTEVSIKKNDFRDPQNLTVDGTTPLMSSEEGTCSMVAMLRLSGKNGEVMGGSQSPSFDCVVYPEGG